MANPPEGPGGSDRDGRDRPGPRAGTHDSGRMNEPQEQRDGSGRSFFSELRRRRVVRVAIAYAGAAILGLEGADLIFPAIGVPQAAYRFLVVAVLAGFPVALVLTWLYDLTPEGVRRTGTALGEGKLVARVRPWVAYAVGGLLVAGLVAVAALWIRPSPASGRVAAGADVIAVLPFTARGDELAAMSEGMVDLLSRNLDEVGGIRTVDPRSVLHRWRDRMADGPLTAGEELDLGRELEAGSVLTGSIVPAGREVRIQARLRGVDGRVLAPQVTVDGGIENLLELVDRLSVDLLREIWRAEQPLPSVEVSGITTGSLEAIRSFLAGERHYRASEFQLAMAEFERAAAADTSFALAYYRLARSAGWVRGRADARVRYAALARRFADRLPSRARVLVVAEELSTTGRIGEAIDTLQAAAERWPDDPELWLRLADDIYHERDERSGPGGRPPRERLALFDRVLELDPSFLPALIHPLEVAFGEADGALIDRYLGLLEAAPSASPSAVEILRTAADAVRTPDAVGVLSALTLSLPNLETAGTDLEWQATNAVFGPVLRAAVTLPPVDREMVVAWLRDRATEAGATGKAARRALYQVLAATGRLADARGVLEEILAEAEGAPRPALAPLLAGYVDRASWPVPAALAEAPAAGVELALDLLRALDAGDPAAVEAAARRLEASSAFDEESRSGLADAGRGLARAMRGDVEAGLAAAETSLAAVPLPPGGVVEALWFRWLTTLAEAEETRDRALTLLRRPWRGTPIYDVLRLELLGRTLEAAGARGEAREALSRFAAILSAADPGLPISRRAAAAERAAAAAPSAGGEAASTP